jgi:hypothetical protein
MTGTVWLLLLLLLYAAGCAVGCVVCFPAIVAVVMLSMARPGTGSDPVKTYGTVSISNVLRDRSVKKLDYLACRGLLV